MNFKKTQSGKSGGLFNGPSHDDGGIPIVVTSTNQPIEVEGGEIIINKKASKLHCKELSKINQSAGNGIEIPCGDDYDKADKSSFHSGGPIPTQKNTEMTSDYLKQLGKYKSDLAQGLELQELMKKSNAIVKKYEGNKLTKESTISELVKLGLKEGQAESLLQPDFANRTGFASYKLTNNNANNKRLQGRISDIEKKYQGAKEVSKTGQGETYVFDGGTIEVNYELDRVQVLFPGDGRVEKELFRKMRSNGYVFSPSNKAFQRKITPQAISNAIRLFGAKRVEQEEVEKGVDVEKEHTDTLERVASGQVSLEQAPEEIAKDHLVEDANYYDKLEIVESDVVSLNVDKKTEIEEKQKAYYIMQDDWGRKIYKTKEGVPYADIDDNGVLYSLTSQGEPLYPAKNVEIAEKIGSLPKIDFVTPEKKYVRLKQNVFELPKGDIGEILKKPNMFVTEVYFGKNMRGEKIVKTIDNTYLEKVIEKIRVAEVGPSETFIIDSIPVKEETVEPNTEKEFDNEIDPDYNLEDAKKYKEIIKNNPDAFQKKFGLSQLGFTDYKLYLDFKGKSKGHGTIDLTRNAKLGNYTPNVFERMLDIKYFLNNALNHFDDKRLLSDNLFSKSREWVSKPKHTEEQAPEKTLGQASEMVILEFKDFEDQIISELEAQGEMTRSDAQGVFEANKGTFENQFSMMPISKMVARFLEEGEKPKQNKKSDLVTAKYDNQYVLNKGIEQFLTESKEAGVDKHEYTTEEKVFLKKYSGYGGLSKFGTAGQGAFFEYYTPVPIIRKMWALAYKYGYKGGPILESSVGTGEFLAFAPKDASITAYEVNPFSADVCRILYPQADVITQPFEKVFIHNNYTMKDKIEPKYDLCIGNPPYGSFEVVKSRYMAMGELDHVKAKNYAEYFMRRSLDLLNPGGLLILIVGASVINGGQLFLDSDNSPVKEYLAQHSDLVDAYRLPDSIFERTDVTTEIIVLQKK